MEQKEQITAVENSVDVTPVEEKPKKKLSKISRTYRPPSLHILPL